jgi:all-trans-retinol 13,14-reductase
VRRELRALPPSMAHVCLYVGLDCDDRALGTGAANLWVHAGPDHDANYARFCSDPESPLPFAFISFPSAKDPDFPARFPGRATIEVISPAPFAWFTAWSDSRLRHRGAACDELKARLHARLLDALYAAVPQVKGHVRHAELSTPLSTRHFANAPEGEIYGLAHTPARFASRLLQPRTPVQNLLLTGQDAALCGVTGALFGAALTASVLLRRNLLGVIAKSA